MRLGFYRFLSFWGVIGFAMFDQMPSEISFQGVYFPPFFFTVVFGFICAIGTSKLLNVTKLSRFFWHPGLAFVAFWVLETSLVGLFFISP